MGYIDFNKVIAYSMSKCYNKSRSRCAEYVKKAFECGGCKYIGGNGWSNQKWCEANGFELIGDIVPEDYNPRPHNGKGIQFPAGYVQQVGDVCLIQHGIYGHICYATGPGIDDWVSDYFQRPPGQQAGTGPYCYTGNVKRVQFWRHNSVLNGAPRVQTMMRSMYADVVDDSARDSSPLAGMTNNVRMLSSSTRRNEDVLRQDEEREEEFRSLAMAMSNSAPNMGRDILISSEMYDSNILKGSQESRKERV